ncbi:synaptotagmin 1-like [Acanthaster planci]|uniref:Synaptotagmin 1-like n=1 Tax=Acanthaster planci TaxID=133434 RepID=A0A8B7YSL8_ACAPL|nr:synaptotagmin 1-like [Acanthaster planci]
MYPDRQRRVLSAPSKNSTGETLLVTADFDGVKSAVPSVTVCLCYRPHKNKFLVTVVKAKDLKKSTVRKDSYVEVNLFRGIGDKARMQTVRTKSYFGGRNPVYKEAFSFELPSRGLASVYTELSFTVRRHNLVRTDEVLGRVTLSSEMLLRWKKSQSLAGTLDEAFSVGTDWPAEGTSMEPRWNRAKELCWLTPARIPVACGAGAVLSFVFLFWAALPRT